MIIAIISVLLIIGIIIIFICFSDPNRNWPEDNSANYITAVYYCLEYFACNFYDDEIEYRSKSISSITVDGFRVQVTPSHKFRTSVIKQ